jgi:protoporphyrinogen oxidase
MTQKKAIIIGAGPAGLTAAYEFLEKTDIQPIVYEMSEYMGGIAKTVNYKGNRIDIGGHRFFSKSDVVMNWWQKIMPIQGALSKDDLILNINYQGKTRDVQLSKSGPDPEKNNLVMLIRKRLSRIFFLRKFFNYPVSLSAETITNLGFVRLIKIGISYVLIRLFPIKKEKSLEDFFINRFGKELYETFFKDYTEKVWGVPCNEIKPEWGAQRIKGLSITKTLLHAIKKLVKAPHRDASTSISQKDTETSLIERFMYPKLGPGQLWEEVARIIKEKNGEIHINKKVIGINYDGEKIKSIKIKDIKTNEVSDIEGDYFFSTMSIKDLINSFNGSVDDDVKRVANGLQYRDFITVGLLLKKLKIKNQTTFKTVNNVVPDNWIYIQERDVKIGRLQVFNNWSPYLVNDLNTVWLGLEYFCNIGDELWSKADDEFIKFAIDELVKIDIIEKADVLDSTILRVEKTYPAYFGTYDDLYVVKDFVNKIDNLYLVGRNGLHRYNNQDHSMLTAITAVENIINGVKSKENIWSVNTEEDYHEEKK